MGNGKQECGARTGERQWETCVERAYFSKAGKNASRARGRVQGDVQEIRFVFLRGSRWRLNYPLLLKTNMAGSSRG